MTAVLGVADRVASDAELVALATAGDRDAFRELFDRHAPRVAATCRAKARSAADVDDAVQEAFARALANLDQLRNPDTFGGWVRSIAVRACMDQHRAAKRVVVIDDETHGDVPDHAPLPDEMLERAERDELLWASLERLGERDRTALYLRHVVEAPVAAVAEELGLTEGSTRVMLTRARERLRLVASGLASLVPLSWRQWLREHLPAATPAMEAMAVAVVVGVAATMGASGARSEPATRVVPVEAPAPAKAQQRPHKGGGGRAVIAPKPARPESAPRSGAPVAEPPPPKAPAEDETRRRPLRRVRDSVDVRRDYPEPDESDELFDVTVFTGTDDKDVPHENSLRVYGDDVDAAVDAAAGALGAGE